MLNIRNNKGRLSRQEQQKLVGGSSLACWWTCLADGREYGTYKKCRDNCPTAYPCELVC